MCYIKGAFCRNVNENRLTELYCHWGGGDQNQSSKWANADANVAR